MTTLPSKNINWFKLTGLALLIHVVLVIISIAEVFVYSMFINPGKEEHFYEGHAEVTAPWVSGIFGSIFIFLIVRRFIKRNSGQHLTYAIAFPVVYIVTDILILIPFQIDWSEHIPVFLMANGIKLVAALTSYSLYK